MKVIFLALLVVLSTQTTTLTVSTAVCSCTQILNETECRAKQCQWNDTKCQAYVGSTTTYCSLIAIEKCSTTEGCAAVSEKCVSFSGCTMYLNTTNDLCQLISSKCTSDGTTCIELDQCKNYKNQTSCYKNENGKYCTWNKDDSTCKDIEKCDDLPAGLGTDALCRAQLSGCTVGSDGKCVASAETCELQTIQNACVTDKTGTKVCIWDATNNVCKEKTCANAPATNTTYDQCKKYLQTCTLNDASAGCVDLPAQCASLKTLNNCIINSSGQNCYWNTNTLKCEDKNCDNATADLKSDSDCINWLPACTVKPTGIGCMNRPATCQANTVQIQCYNDSNGGACYWNGTACVDKSCANSPDSNVNNDNCQSFLSTCTVQVDLTGCETKKANCTEYTIEQQCVSQLDGTLCVYQENKCIQRKCDNAPVDYIADSQCKQFSQTCMLNSVTQAGCITQTCNNITFKEQCLQDYQNNSCYYGQVCQLRSCDNAPKTYKSDEECRSFLSSCTVADSLTGCKTRPATCAELNEQQCKPLTDGTKCSWNVTTDPSNPVCRNLDCSDITSNNQTNDTCSAFDPSCTVAENPSICVAKPSVCDGIVSSDQCFAIVLDDKVSTCSWNAEAQKCRQRTCSDAPITITKEADCRTYLSSCTINSGNAGCIDQPNACTGYTSKDVCVKLYPIGVVAVQLCGWNGCEARSCKNAPVLTDGVYDHSSCNTYLSSCTVNSDRSGCVNRFTVCSDITTDELWCNDTILVDGSRCSWDTTGATPVCRAFTCTDNTASAMTEAGCTKLLSSCTLGINGKGCVNKFTQCPDITDSVQCEGTTLSNASFCSWDTITDAANPSCVARACKFSPNKAKSSDCSTYLSSCTLGSSTEGCITKPTQCNGLTSDQCNNVILNDGSLCSWNNTISDSAVACEARTCADATTDLNTDALCRTWLSSCTVTADEAGCVSEPADCTQMTRSQCVQQFSKKVSCFWNATANPASCRAAQCTDASKTIYTTDALCAGYIATCTVAAAGGCITKPTSCSSLAQNHCPKVTISATGKDASQNQCSWNLTNAVCQDRICTDAPSTYVTESACRGWLKTCTINVTGQGCITEPATCALLQIQSQCQILANGTKCGWNTGCVNRTCSNAPDTLTTHEMCNEYLSTCTVQSDATGCITQAATCSAITVQIQCVKANVLCQWNTKTSTCQDRSCTNASTTLTTHNACNAYLNSCTVKPTGVGCQSLQDKCSGYATIGQCQITTSKSKCQWIINYEVGSCVDVYTNCSTYAIQPSCTTASDGTLCIWIEGSCFSRECSQAPKSYATHELCQKFSQNCTTNGKGCIDYQKCGSYTMANSCIKGTDGLCILVDKCQNISCNIAPTTYKTDSECATFLKTCTTNGNGCVERKRCQDVYIEEACKTNSTGQQCAWYKSQCVDKICDTAPNTVISEKDCETYFPGGNCTTIKGGGCTAKSKCKNAQIEGACTTQLDGQACSWQNGTCKLKSCTDLKGYDHRTCNSQQSSCTTDGYICTSMQTCSNTTVQAACVAGTDGPCLWANGKCYRYTKCTDLTFSTHTQCNSIHAQCTSNGINCIAITTCAQTPKVGCFAGIEGGLTVQCVWTPTSTSLSADYQCVKYSGCTDVKYLNHSDCYKYTNGQCTTDGQAFCIALDICTNYTTQASCNIDKNGQIVKSSLVTATGKCKWTSDSKCVAQGCSDLDGTNHTSCYNQLSTCTYNGVKCIVQSTCSTYVTSVVCIQATGTDGKCKWDNGKCFAMACSDYPVTLCTMHSSLCIQDGSVCVLQTDCSNYTTQSACDFGSATQVCAWIGTSVSTKGKCVAVSSCTIATPYQKACTKLSDRCYWQTITVANVVEHICATKTCEMQIDGTCTGFYDWSGKTYTVCQYDSSGKCVSTEPTGLQRTTCSLQTLYQYTWNPTTNKCSVCNAPVTPTNNTTTTNQTNTTTYGYIGNLFYLVPLYAIM